MPSLVTSLAIGLTLSTVALFALVAMRPQFGRRVNFFVPDTHVFVPGPGNFYELWPNGRATVLEAQEAGPPMLCFGDYKIAQLFVVEIQIKSCRQARDTNFEPTGEEDHAETPVVQRIVFPFFPSLLMELPVDTLLPMYISIGKHGRAGHAKVQNKSLAELNS